MDGELIFEEPAVRRYLDTLPSDRTQFYVVDQNVWNHHREFLSHVLRLKADTELLVVPADESHKTPEMWTGISRELLRRGIRKGDILVSLGGGALTDVTTCVASSLYRGVSHLIFPTTLLSQIDAGIGGKGAVNVADLKNAMGTFHFPDATLILPPLLSTLPESEIRSGWGEMLKHAVLMGPSAFSKVRDFLFQHGPTIQPVAHALFRESAEFKAKVVETDPFEVNGTRRFLHLGHELAHRLERALPIPHGLAVAWGTAVMAHVSTQLAGFPLATAKEISDLALLLNRPHLENPGTLWQVFEERLESDFEGIGLSDLGKPRIIHSIPVKMMREAFFRTSFS